MKYFYRKIFPYKNSLDHKLLFQIVFLTNNSIFPKQKQFWGTCNDFLERLKKIPPFNLLKNSLGCHFRIFGIFGNNYESESNVMGRSNSFQEKVESEFFINTQHLEYFLKQKVLLTSSNQYLSFEKLFEKIPPINSHTLFVIPVTKLDPSKFNGESWAQYREDMVNYLSLSLDGNWEQIVLRAIGGLLGLGDESENTGDNFLQPEEDDGDWMNYRYPNLTYFDDPEALSQKKGDLKWKSLESLPFHNMPVENKKSPKHPNTPDLSLPKYNYAPENIQLWEGGGGYRTKIYRSAHDCIMRRRIGDENLPLRKEKLAFCKVCETQLEHMIFSESNFRSGLFIYD